MSAGQQFAMPGARLSALQQRVRQTRLTASTAAQPPGSGAPEDPTAAMEQAGAFAGRPHAVRALSRQPAGSGIAAPQVTVNVSPSGFLPTANVQTRRQQDAAHGSTPR